MSAWLIVLKDAVECFRTVFADANRVATERIVNVPNVRETSLDGSLARKCCTSRSRWAPSSLAVSWRLLPSSFLVVKFERA
jgi:hypothetical protein